MNFLKNSELMKFAEKAINSDLPYGSAIYQIISTHYSFHNTFLSLDKSEAFAGINSNKKIPYDTQILLLLNKLFYQFDKFFPLLYNQRLNIIGHLLCFNRTNIYLSSKYSLTDNNYSEYYESLLNIIFIQAFYDNLHYNYSLFEKILKERRINYKKVDLNNISHQRKLLKLLSDLSFCNNKNDVSWLFDDLNTRIAEAKGHTCRQRKTKEELEQKAISINQKYMKKIIEQYNQKKEYIKFFNAN